MTAENLETPCRVCLAVLEARLRLRPLESQVSCRGGAGAPVAEQWGDGVLGDLKPLKVVCQLLRECRKQQQWPSHVTSLWNDSLEVTPSHLGGGTRTLHTLLTQAFLFVVLGAHDAS